MKALNATLQTGLILLSLAFLPECSDGQIYLTGILQDGVSANGETIPDLPPARFALAADAPPQVVPLVSKPGPAGELLLHSLRLDERCRLARDARLRGTEDEEEHSPFHSFHYLLLHC